MKTKIDGKSRGRGASTARPKRIRWREFVGLAPRFTDQAEASFTVRLRHAGGDIPGCAWLRYGGWGMFHAPTPAGAWAPIQSGWVSHYRRETT